MTHTLASSALLLSSLGLGAIGCGPRSAVHTTPGPSAARVAVERPVLPPPVTLEQCVEPPRPIEFGVITLCGIEACEGRYAVGAMDGEGTLVELAQLDAALRARAAGGERDWPWFVTATGDVPDATIRELAVRAVAAGLTEASPCRPPEGWAITAEGAVFRPSPVLEGQRAAVGPLGGLSREAIRTTIRANIAEVRDCYETALLRSPELRGRVNVTFVIGPDGSVTSAEVSESTLGSGLVETCIASRVRRWHFPTPDPAGSVLVTYPFVLDSGE
jgi:TonB family protein